MVQLGTTINFSYCKASSLTFSGGVDASGNTLCDLWSLTPGNNPTFQQEGTLGVCISGFSFTSTSTDVYIYGGINEKGEFMDQTIRIDLDSLQAVRVKVAAKNSPPPMAYSSLATINDTVLFLYGGKGVNEVSKQAYFFNVSSGSFCLR